MKFYVDSGLSYGQNYNYTMTATFILVNESRNLSSTSAMIEMCTCKSQTLKSQTFTL